MKSLNDVNIGDWPYIELTLLRKFYQLHRRIFHGGLGVSLATVHYDLGTSYDSIQV